MGSWEYVTSDTLRRKRFSVGIYFRYGARGGRDWWLSKCINMRHVVVKGWSNLKVYHTWSVDKRIGARHEFKYALSTKMLTYSSVENHMTQNNGPWRLRLFNKHRWLVDETQIKYLIIYISKFKEQNKTEYNIHLFCPITNPKTLSCTIIKILCSSNQT